MKIAIKIALIWLSIFDKHRLLFKTIKTLHGEIQGINA